MYRVVELIVRLVDLDKVCQVVIHHHLTIKLHLIINLWNLLLHTDLLVFKDNKIVLIIKVLLVLSIDMLHLLQEIQELLMVQIVELVRLCMDQDWVWDHLV